MLRVKEICAKQGITLGELAQRMGIQPPSITSAVKGNPTLSTLEAMASALGVHISELFESQELLAVIEYKGKVFRASSVEHLKEITTTIEKDCQ